MPAHFEPNTQQASKREAAAESRSTSAGSRQSGEKRYTGLPEYEYPLPFHVRNTFIETNVGRPDSLEAFFEERRIHSSPAVPRQREEEASDSMRPPESQLLRHAITAQAQALMTSVATATGFWTGTEQERTTTPVDNLNASQQAPCVLRLSDVLQGPALGSNALPTVGSVGHHVGTCKPCAFFYTRGCENGSQCSFCHLCPPEEKRRRQKEKHEAFKEMRRERRQIRL